VTHLRQIMREELRQRNYAESTIHAYIHTVEHFSRHFHRSPDQLGPERPTMLTRTPVPASSMAADFVMPSTACLLPT
jgi:hypothetical protein